ncbi:MAG: DegT/DnrJ/EryC1/StrS family aminotransferase, partial [Pirellulales bacterium]
MHNPRLSVIPEARSSSGAAAAGIRVPFVRPALPTFESVRSAYEEILRGGQLTKGRYVESLEQALAKRLGVRHCVAVSSCTVGLMLV